MARRQNLGESADWFTGEAKTLPFEIYSSDEATIQDVTGWSCSWTLRRVQGDDEILLTKTTGGSGITITGSYNATPATNTQRISVAVTSGNTTNLQPGLYWHCLRRTDSSSETVLSYGDVTLKRA